MNLKYKLFGLHFSVPVKCRTVSISAERIKAAVQNPFFDGLKDMLLLNRGEYTSEKFDALLNSPLYLPSLGEVRNEHVEFYTNMLIGYDTDTNKQNSWDVIGMNHKPFQFDVLQKFKGVTYMIGSESENRLLFQTQNYELFVERLQHPEDLKSIGSKQIMIKTDYDNPCTNLFNKDFIKDSDLLSVFNEWNKGIFNV
ncbi:TPA: hypothetical protein ACXLHC_004950 [Klebsiella pneumoniae]